MTSETTMRDQHDAHTADAFPAKRGRPCLDAEQGPLTPAERAKRYRQMKKADVRSALRKRGDLMLDQYSDAALLDAIRASIAAGASAKSGRLVAELARRYP